MARWPLRIHTCKIVTFTSLIWFMLDVFLIMYFTERTPCLCPDNVNTQNRKLDIVTSDFRKEKLFNKDFNIVSDRNPKAPRGKFYEWSEPVEIENPSHWPGERGKGLTIGKSEEALKNEKFKLNQFNLLASDRIALNRSLVDVRMNECKNIQYPKTLPRTSIVIVFHNEAWSTLIRTVTSIIIRSPRELLEDIILVDDASDRDHLKKPLEDYVAKFSVPTQVLRMPKRSGLIRARLEGAALCKGQIITFLDAHCECTKGWLQPLIARVAEDKSRVVSPIIDVISDETFDYISASDMTWGGFNWRLNFRWYRVPQREVDRRGGDRTLPLRTPTMAGGLFSIDRDYFESIGKYDEGMEIWGGENLELSFRIWMCGGTLEIVTCSHVGHVFRKSTPYTFPGGTGKIVNHNNARLAEVWLDEWKNFYYSINPGAKSSVGGDVSGRKFLRRKLKCKSFRWYLENIYPESQMPLDYYYLGDIKHTESGNCLDTFGRKGGENIAVGPCHKMGGNQIFAYTKRGQVMSDDNCLDCPNSNGPVKLVRCHNMGGNQKWEYRDDKSLYHPSTKKCLSEPLSKDKQLPVLAQCKPGDKSQVWVMNGKFKWQAT